MKKTVAGLGSVFRRRRCKEAAADEDGAPADVAADDGPPVIERISTIHKGQREPSLRVVDVARGRSHGATATVSTLTNERPEATMKMSERLIHEATCDSSMRTTYKEVEPLAVGIDHLSMREQMWYKNQMYLLAKQQDEFSPPRTLPRISTRYESNDRFISTQNRESPKGVTELIDEFPSTTMYSKVKNCDSRKEVRFRSSKFDQVQSSQVSRFDDNDTKQSSSLVTQDDASTNQSSSLFDDDTRTIYSSSLLQDEDTTTIASGRNIDEVTLGSILDDAILEESTMEEGQSYLTSLTDGTSYKFQMGDDGRQRRKYQYGVGHNPTISKSRRGTTNVAAPPSITANESTSTRGRRVTVIAPRGRREKNSIDDSDFIDDEEEAACPLLPAILEEVSGTVADAKSALNQVLYAFFISEDDIDRVSDKLRDAKLELVEIYNEREGNARARRCCPDSVREALL